MPLYTFQCSDCQQADDRFLKLSDYERTRDKQKCENCGAKMRRVVNVPTLAGLDSGPDGFLRGRQENDGVCDDFARQRIERNYGGKLGGGFFVPGLCRPGQQFDPYAVCHSRDEVIAKARALGVGVRGPGINVEPRMSEAEIKQREEGDDGVPSEKAIKATLNEEIVKNHGGRVTKKKAKELSDMLRDRHRRRDLPKTRDISAIYE
jgi:putative FmdB family regulatory protein